MDHVFVIESQPDPESGQGDLIGIYFDEEQAIGRAVAWKDEFPWRWATVYRFPCNVPLQDFYKDTEECPVKVIYQNKERVSE